MTDGPLLTPRQVGERLQLGATATYELLASGRVQTYRVGPRGRQLRVSEGALQDYLESCRTDGEDGLTRGLQSPVRLEGRRDRVRHSARG